MSNSRIIIGVIIILIGLGSLFGFDVFRLIIPILLIWWGYTVLTGRGSHFNDAKSSTQEDTLDEVLIFSGVNKRVESKEFTGGRVVCIFGGAELDFSEAKAKDNIHLEVVTVFGGAKIRVPKTWDVRSEATAIFGGVSNRTERPKSASTVVRLTGASIFGGTDILN